MTIVYTVSIIGMAAIAAITAIGSSSDGVKKYYFPATICFTVIWLTLQYIIQAIQLSDLIALYLIRLTSLIALFISVSFYLFIRSYINKPVALNKVRFIYSISLLSGIILNFFVGMITGVEGSDHGIVISSSYLYTVYMVIIALIFTLSLYNLSRFTMDIKAKRDRQKNTFMMYGVLQSVVLILASSFLQSFAESQALIPISLFIMTIIIGLAITKYQLFDIKLAVIRTATYILSLLTLSVIYYLLALVVSLTIFKGELSHTVSISPINIVLALILAFIFQPIRKFFDKITNRIFYRDGYDIGDFVSNLNRMLSSTTDLRGLLERASYEIGRTLKSEQAFFFINTKNGHYVCAGTSHHKQLPKVDAERLELAISNGEVVIATLREKGDPIRRLMISHRIEVVLPLVRSKKVIGFLCLGDSLLSGYTGRDVKVLKTVSEELIIAIQNALAVEEIRDFNENLQQRINNATKELRASNATLRQLDKVKDEFVGMASHQLRTPLTSVKGYISMVLDGDAGKITADQRKFLNEAYVSSEHMVALINDFLNVSRLQTGKFVIEKTKFDLSKVVGQEIDILQPNAKARGLRYEYIEPKNFPLVEADEAKIRQVIMNFADNALYYSRENSTINIILTVEGGEAVYKVQDTGIGVPINEQSKLFTKFFRATNARRQRPDGTGVGLYLAKKIIESHGGKIIFESVEGKGSTFGFSLPISK